MGLHPNQSKIFPSPGLFFVEWVNQAYRECEVVTLTRTRFQVEYETNAGCVRSWRNLDGDGCSYHIKLSTYDQQQKERTSNHGSR